MSFSLTNEKNPKGYEINRRHRVGVGGRGGGLQVCRLLTLERLMQEDYESMTGLSHTKSSKPALAKYQGPVSKTKKQKM